MKAVFLFLLIFVAHANVVHGNNDHDIHLSMCELRFNEESSSFEIAIKIFIDDLELAIQRSGTKHFKLDSGDTALTNEHIASYVDKNFIIEIDGRKLQGDFLGKETTEDLLAVWCYIEFKAPKESRKCVMSNKILFDLYDDQRNIMDIKMSKSHKDYTILERAKSTWTYTYPSH